MLDRLGTLALGVAIAALAVGPSFAGTFDAIQVPEPATIGLVATGIGVLGTFAWIKSRKK